MSREADSSRALALPGLPEAFRYLCQRGSLPQLRESVCPHPVPLVSPAVSDHGLGTGGNPRPIGSIAAGNSIERFPNRSLLREFGLDKLAQSFRERRVAQPVDCFLQEPAHDEPLCDPFRDAAGQKVKEFLGFDLP